MKAAAGTAITITRMTMSTIMRTGIRMAEAALYDLMTWMSPAWPIGAFAHSGGLEWAVEAGHVRDRASCAEWIADLLEYGAIRNDAVLFVRAWRAADAGDAARLRDVAELAAASQVGFERRLEATAQGAAFRRIAEATVLDPSLPWDDRRFGSLLADIDSDDLTYPIAAATLFASQSIPLTPALTAWLHGAVSNLVSAAQRLVPLGQTDGQRILRDLRQNIFTAAATAAELSEGDPFDQLGGAALVADIGCMAHETQYTRLFRT